MADESYAQQFSRTFSVPYEQLDTASPLPKPSNEAQAREPFARRAPFSRVWATLMRPVLGRAWSTTDVGRLTFFSLTHVALVLAPTLFFSWRNLAVAFIAYCMGGMGITYSYHRQLAHRSFRTPKWLEYLAAYVGAMFAVQGAPMEWVSDHRCRRCRPHPTRIRCSDRCRLSPLHPLVTSAAPAAFAAAATPAAPAAPYVASAAPTLGALYRLRPLFTGSPTPVPSSLPSAAVHRYHHLHTETPLDPHSSYEGFWWSHVGWMLDSEIYNARCGDRRNVRSTPFPPFPLHQTP